VSEHSRRLDQTRGIAVAEIEAKLLSRARALRAQGDVNSWGEALHGAQSWVGLEPQTLETPYEELARMCQALQRDVRHVVDLGAGYGRLGHVLHQFYPAASFTGFEIVPERVEEGNRVLAREGLTRARLYCVDLAGEDFVMPRASAYLIYDFGNRAHLRRALDQLGELALTQHFEVLARGGTIRSLIDHAYPWLLRKELPVGEEAFALYGTC